MKKVVQLILIFSFLFVLTACNNDSNVNNINKDSLQTMYLAKPLSGRPKSQKEIDNIFIALNVLKDASYYESESSGEVVAKKAVKLATQSVNNRKIITPDASFSESISISSFVKVAEQLYESNGEFLKREASKVTSSSVKWENSASYISDSEYKKNYGYCFSDPTRYIINEQTIIGDIEVINNGIGRKYTYKFNLDPVVAPYYYKTSIKKLSNSSSEPVFKYIEMQITFDYKWRISKIETKEEYSVTISPLGSVDCTSTLVENFSNINKSISIEEASFFNKFL